MRAPNIICSHGLCLHWVSIDADKVVASSLELSLFSYFGCVTFWLRLQFIFPTSGGCFLEFGLKASFVIQYSRLRLSTIVPFLNRYKIIHFFHRCCFKMLHLFFVTIWNLLFGGYIFSDTFICVHLYSMTSFILYWYFSFRMVSLADISDGGKWYQRCDLFDLKRCSKDVFCRKNLTDVIGLCRWKENFCGKFGRCLLLC